jgi:AAA family ATP:ADP antiporter
MAVQGGVENLPWLFSATFAAMLLTVPAFGFAAARLPRRRLGLAGLAAAAIPGAILWLALGLLLGRRHSRLRSIPARVNPAGPEAKPPRH